MNDRFTSLYASGNDAGTVKTGWIKDSNDNDIDAIKSIFGDCDGQNPHAIIDRNLSSDHSSNIIMIPYYDYKVKFLNIIYDPPHAIDGIQMQRNSIYNDYIASESTNDVKIIYNQLNKLYGDWHVEKYDQTNYNWLYCALNHANRKNVLQAISRLRFCDLAVIMFSCHGFRSRQDNITDETYNGNEQGLAAAAPDSVDTSIDSNIEDFKNSLRINEKCAINIILRYIKRSLVIIPSSCADVSMQPGI